MRRSEPAGLTSRAAFVLGCELASVLAGLAAPGCAHAAVRLSGQRADYDLSLSRSTAGIIAASGRMRFDVTETCRAWATDQTLDLSTVDREGDRSSTHTDYATFETKDGRSFSFRMFETGGGQPPSLIAGQATRPGAGDAATVAFTSPHGLVLHLPPGTLFPMAHTAALIEAAEAGQPSISRLLFDGTGTDGAEYTHAELLGWGPPAPPVPARSLEAMPAGQMEIAFYPLGGHDELPQYATGVRYFANGVGDRLEMDFGQFSMRGTVTKLVLPVDPDCPPAAR